MHNVSREMESYSANFDDENQLKTGRNGCRRHGESV